MARILGLDLGSYSVKAFWLEGTMRSPSGKGFQEVRLPAVGDSNADLSSRIQTALGELLATPAMAVEQVVVAMPGPSIATHSMSLPFVDLKRIEATLPYEVEGQLPFDLGDAVFDYQIAQTHEQKSDVLVGVARKAELSSLLSMLQTLKLEPRIITHSGMVLFHLVMRHSQGRNVVASEAATAVVDLGHERTNVAIGRLSHGVEVARAFAAGGKDVTKAISQEFQVSLEEAEKWKNEHAAVGQSAGYGPDAERARTACMRGLQAVLRELRPTLKAYAAKMHVPIERIVLCGGTARMKGIAEQLTQDLGIPVELFSLPSDARGQTKPADDVVAGQAYALAVRGQSQEHKNNRFNLRRGEFAFKGDLDYVKDKVPQIAVMGLVLLLLLVASGVVRNTLLANRRKDVEKEFCQTTENIIGRCEKNYDLALSLLRGQESPAASIPKTSALNFLTDLTQRLPNDVPILMDRIDVEMDRIALRLETDSTKHVDAITTALRSHPCFKEVQEGKIEKSADGQKVNVQLKIEVSCPETEEGQG